MIAPARRRVAACRQLPWSHANHIRSALLALAPTVDLTGVVSTLESHWVVLDAELSEIRKDFAVLRALTRKHGEFWMRPMAQLKKLRTQKENLLKEIKFQMELFNLHIQQGRDLCTKLSSVASVIKTPPAQLQSQLAIEVVSPILANSQNPLPVTNAW
ncbi:hypothetical protein Ctob_008754 [Chrysochromulina tobinii]|uniref:Uncharacterized protein n=1 Tax=Chrysochromulina tobinii TaxID=1460289 RepID=A0A0M0JIT7_9EUKA|nr:hypothetical protein Ctob_008754 [Chrysochromulina tobinii]|eukprot:KOO26496.1 hypothetical protein Ctob_008754 [Chrysochromulina sp. CCMP291]